MSVATHPSRGMLRALLWCQYAMNRNLDKSNIFCEYDHSRQNRLEATRFIINTLHNVYYILI